MTGVRLPTFENPPVGEVVLSVQFAKLSKLQAAHFGQFWDTIKGEFPRTETHPPIDAIVERFERPESAPKLRFQFTQGDVIPRAWFISRDDTHLIQVQADRFICNWRRSAAMQPYPRFPEIKGFFERHWSNWLQFLRTNGLVESIKIEQCEVTYTNHIAQSGIWHDYSEANKVVLLLSSSQELSSDLKPEFASVATHHLISRGDGAGEPIGRLHVDFDPGIEAKTKAPIFILNLVARGLISPDIRDVSTFFEIGRRLIVTTFAAITTPAMHGAWGLKEEE